MLYSCTIWVSISCELCVKKVVNNMLWQVLMSQAPCGYSKLNGYTMASMVAMTSNFMTTCSVWLEKSYHATCTRTFKSSNLLWGEPISIHK